MGMVLSLIAGLFLLGCGDDSTEDKQVMPTVLDLVVEQQVCELQSGGHIWDKNGKTSNERCSVVRACAKTPNTPYLIESTGACATKAQYDQALAESICEKAQQEYDQATGACRSGVSGARKSRVAKAKAHCKKKTDGSKWNAGTKKCDPAPVDDGEEAAFAVSYAAGVFTLGSEKKRSH